MHAVRNMTLCTKDCLCLYVCPTGATDTETGQIDPEKCLSGCRACVDACPSHAISLVPEIYPKQQNKKQDTKVIMGVLSKSKTQQESIAGQLADTADSDNLSILMKAIEKSSRIIAEDVLREAGFMLPQSKEVLEFLIDLLAKEKDPHLPTHTINQLIHLIEPMIPMETKEMKQYLCSVCGYIHKGQLPEDFQCPVCGQPASAFEPVNEQ